MTRADARDVLVTAAAIGLSPQITEFPLAKANEALEALKHDAFDGAGRNCLLMPQRQPGRRDRMQRPAR
jgi:D-arabinose 1-dehydrogenase-like Zn-dependent alcohol dehydrogenase